MWCGLPTPAVPEVALSGFAFNQAISSGRSFGGRFFLPTISCELSVTSATGSKSFSTSYCSEYIAPLKTCVLVMPMISV